MKSMNFSSQLRITKDMPEEEVIRKILQFFNSKIIRNLNLKLILTKVQSLDIDAK